MTKKRRRPIHLHVMVSEAEQALIQERMAEAGIRNMGAYMRKMALSVAVPQGIGNDPCRTDVLLFMTFLFFGCID